MANTAVSRAARERAQVEAQRVEKIRKGWADRHPKIAREERALRKANHQTRKAYKHKRNGTPETHAKAAAVRQGALARLCTAGDINVEQLAAAVSIALVHARITAPVTIGTVSYETRVDQGGAGAGLFFEKLGAVRAEVTYTHWRQRLIDPAVVLAMIVEDLGVTRAAAKFRMRNTRAKQLLIAALNLWIEMNAQIRREIDHASLAAAQAGIL